MKVGISPLRSNKVCSLTAALVFRNRAQGKPISKDQLSMNPKHKPSLSVQGRNHHRHIAAAPHGSRFGQSRCISANHDFHLHLPKYFERLYPLFPYGKASLAWPSDSTRYHEGFHDRSVEQMPCIKIDHSM
jgi:hypothetical protein